MRKIRWMAAIFLLTLMVCGCGASSEDTVSKTGQKESISQDKKEEKQKETESLDEPEETEEVLQGDTENKIRILNIYYSNEMADGLEKTQIEADTLSPELLLSNLSNYNIVTRATRVNSAETIQEGEDKVLLLDMSQEFENHVSSMGTSGEYVIIAAVTNTFLDAYEAQKLRLTVEGDYLETGHAIYDWDLVKYQLTSYTVNKKTYEKNNIKLEYPQLINLKVSYMEDEWNEVLEAYARKDLDHLDERSQYNLTYEVATATEELLSVIYRVEAYEPGAAHPYKSIRTFNIDLTTGKEWRLKDFIDTEKIVKAFENDNYRIINTEFDEKDIKEYLKTNADMITETYFDAFDLNSEDLDAYIPGYSYRLDGQIVICIEVPHVLGDYLEILVL